MKRQPFFAKSHCFLRACAHGAFCTALRRGAAHIWIGKRNRTEAAFRAKKTAPERDDPFCVKCATSRPIGVAEGHSMSILLLGFLG